MKIGSRSLFILWGMIVSIFVCVCSVSQNGNVQEQKVDNEIKNYIFQEDVNIDFVEQEESSDTQMEDVSTNHLVYRGYEIGTEYASGDVIGIDIAKLLQVVSNPEMIVIFYNDEIMEEIPLSMDIEVETSQEVINYFEMTLEKTGYYGFYVKDGVGELHDIGSACMNIRKSFHSYLPLD